MRNTIDNGGILDKEFEGLCKKEKEARKMLKKFYGWKYFFKVSPEMQIELAGDLYYKNAIPADLQEYKRRRFI